MRAGAGVFEGIGGGNNWSFSVPDSERYSILRWTDLEEKQLDAAISSVAIVNRPSEASLYLFDGNSHVSSNDYMRMIPWFNLRFPTPNILPGLDFHGDFLCITKPENSADRFYVPDLGARGFDNRALSILLVSQWHQREERLSAAKILTWPWTLTWDHLLTPALTGIVPSVNIARASDPLFTWLAFPQRSGLSESQVYLVVSQWVVFHASGIGINAWLLFFFSFHVDGGSLRVDLADIAHHVWPGTGQGQLREELDRRKNSLMSAYQILVGTIMSLIPSRCDAVYLLPGDQTGPRPSSPDIRSGDSLEDVTIVLENPTTAPPSILGSLGL